MVPCPSCGNEVPEGQKFCGQCGTALSLACPTCGTLAQPGQRFCGECGTSLTGSPPPAREPGQEPVKEERRVVSVLFIDLVGFTSYSERRDPEEVRSLITQYFDLAREVVERFGGTVDKYIGDAVMAWWGATSSQEDDAERAVRAGLEIVDRVTSLGESVGVPGLAARAGIMTGEASVGPGGNEKGLLLGDLVNSASRLQSIAQPGTVLVGPATAALVSDSIELTDAGTHEVKGKTEPITASRAVRTVSERGGRGRADRLEPPFVGRASELRLIKDMFHATGSDGRARLVSLVGQAGIGKSRLIWEFRKYIDGLIENVYWHEGRSPSYGDGIALWALGEMIRNRARIQETDDDQTTLRLLGEAVSTYVSESNEEAWIRDRLAALLGVGDSAGSERSELFAAARALFERISEKGTTVLVFEDLQWADPSLLEFIEELPDWSQNHPIVVITLTRPDLLDRRPDWGSGRRGFTSLYLGPLTDDEMAELIDGAVPGIPAAARARIVDAADGVPLFAVEMIRTLLADGRLTSGPEGVTAGHLEDLEVPSSVQAVISARLDRLAPADRDLTRDAAVLGYAFTVDGLAALGEETVDKLERRLSDLIRREIFELVRDPLSPERGQYRWVQSLLREVAYGRIARSDRHTLHLRAARYFRDLDEPELAPVAAAHYVSAVDSSPGPDPALEAELVGALQRAIDRAQAVHGYEQVLGLVETALPVVPEEIAIELREVGARAAVHTQDLPVADRHVEALAELATASGDPGLKHRAMAVRGWVANDTRRSEEARPAMEEHLASYPDLMSNPDLARTAVVLSRARMLAGDDAGAAELADTALAAVEHFELLEEIADAMVTRGTALVGTRIHQGMALLRGALRMCEEHDLTATGLRAMINIGYGSADLDEGREMTWRAYEEAKRIGDRGHARFAAGNSLGWLIESLQLSETDDLLADPIFADVPPTDEIGLHTTRSTTALMRGQRQKAVDELAAARVLAEDITDHQVLSFIEGGDRLVDFHDGDYAAVYETYRRRFREVSFAPWISAFWSLNAAAQAGDAGWVTEALEMVRTVPGSKLMGVLDDWGEAMLTILGGEVDQGIHMAESAADAARDLQFRRTEICILAAALRPLPPDHPQRDRLLTRARTIATEAGAAGLVAWLDRSL